MHHFHYRNGVLHVEDMPVPEIAEKVGTPFYCYSTATLTRHYQAFDAALEGLDHLICYAVKANSNRAVLTTLARLGCGADVVSEGELRQAIAAGIPADKIVFAGVGKQPGEMAYALGQGVFQFNVESEPELDMLSQVASGLGLVAPVTIRINPDVDAETHAKISTGHGETKFGIPLSKARAVFKYAATLPGVRPLGVHVHIGSQLTSTGPFRSAFEKVVELVRALRADGHVVERVDLGGGLGVPYKDEAPPLPADYGRVVAEMFGDLGVKLVFEPGRLIVGNAGILVASLVYVKEGLTRRFYITDAAMNDLIRPTLYEAFHRIEPVVEPPAGTPRTPVDIVGPVCETGDIFAEERPMPPMKSGDLLAIFSAGAYGAVMASTYNSRLLVPEVLADGDRFAIVRRRPSYEELTMLEAMPPWLANKG
jgi:diaminopimelate decarboxylase